MGEWMELLLSFVFLWPTAAISHATLFFRDNRVFLLISAILLTREADGMSKVFSFFLFMLGFAWAEMR